METDSESNTSRKFYADKICLVIIITFPISIGILFLSILLERHLSGFTFLVPFFYILFLYSAFIIPILGFCSIKDILSKWQDITSLDKGNLNISQIKKTAQRFRLVALLFIGVSIGVIFVLEGITKVIIMSLWPLTMAFLGVIIAFLSYRLYNKISISFVSHIISVFTIIISLAAAIAVFSSSSFGDYLIQRYQYSKKTETFSGSSDSLNQTVVIPTLDSPCPEGKNIIWCSSFQLAWNKIKDDVLGEPVQLSGAKEIAFHLNNARQSAEDIESDSFYAAAGRIGDGIVDKINKEMAVKFPSQSMPEFVIDTIIPEAILAYSYLIANVPFKYPFRQVESEFIFTDSNGIRTNVSAFGVWGHESKFKKVREQVEVLYYQRDYNEPDRSEFAVDLCRYSKPYQVVAAIVEPKASLAETLDYISNKIVDSQNSPQYEEKNLLEDADVLMVPEMFWEVDHRFKELIGQVIANTEPAMPIVEARQGIKFKLDRYGAKQNWKASHWL